MNYNICSIEKREKGLTEITFDNGMNCRLYRSELNLLKGEGILIEYEASLSEEQYHFLLCKVIGKRAKKRAMYLLQQRDLSEYRLREKLQKNHYPETCIDEAVRYVREYHYLDDVRYAENFIRYSMDRMSRRQMETKLLQKGVGRRDIQTAMESEYPAEDADRLEQEQIAALLQKRRFDPSVCDEKEYRRTYEYLLRRGFSGEKITRQMRVMGE